MNRNNSINLSNNTIETYKKRIAYHESGHAVAILVNNKKIQLPPPFFKISINGHAYKSPSDFTTDLSIDKSYSAVIDGGRLIKNLPESIGFLPKS
jgi:hypothetical protein